MTTAETEVRDSVKIVVWALEGGKEGRVHYSQVRHLTAGARAIVYRFDQDLLS